MWLLCMCVCAWYLQTRLYAALVHGEFCNAYLFSGNMPAGTNAVVEVIHRCPCPSITVVRAC